mmetsp:Transcript_5640/g.13714  ORF Transcript_5640/g.13714 Transcript_5640/m.13714 type:complete len:208 (-) Transcript_5640:10-633(-)
MYRVVYCHSAFVLPRATGLVPDASLAWTFVARRVLGWCLARPRGWLCIGGHIIPHRRPQHPHGRPNALRKQRRVGDVDHRCLALRDRVPHNNPTRVYTGEYAVPKRMQLPQQPARRPNLVQILARDGESSVGGRIHTGTLCRLPRRSAQLILRHATRLLVDLSSLLFRLIPLLPCLFRATALQFLAERSERRSLSTQQPRRTSRIHI